MIDCRECDRLRGESAAAFAEYTACKDDLAITRKTDKAFLAKRRAFERAQGRLRECHQREANHRAEMHVEDSSAANTSTVEEKFATLLEAIKIGDADAVQDAIFGLGAVKNGWTEIP